MNEFNTTIYIDVAVRVSAEERNITKFLKELILLHDVCASFLRLHDPKNSLFGAIICVIPLV